MDMTLKCQIGGATFLTRNMHDQKKTKIKTVSKRSKVLTVCCQTSGSLMTLDGNTSGLHCLKAPSRPLSSCRDRHRYHHHHHQHQHHHPHHFFFSLAPFSATVSCSNCFTGQSPGKRGTRRAKTQGLCRCLRGWRKSSGRGWVSRGARIWLRLGWLASTLWPQRRKDLGWLRREGWLQRGSWLHVSGWRYSVAAALDGGCLSLARAKLLTKAAASSLHLPPTSIASTANRQRWKLVVEEFWVGSFFAFAGILQSGSCEPSCSASGLAFSSEWWDECGIDCELGSIP